MYKDKIVEEVRNAGIKLAEKCDFDLHKFAMMLKYETEKSKKEGYRVVTYHDILTTKELQTK